MSYYGVTLTKKGRELITKLLATGQPLTLTGIMVGSGVCPDGTYPADLTSLVAPVAAGTSTKPSYEGDKLRMVIEYRSDLNGGLDHGFWLNEFSVQAKDPDPGEEGSPNVMLIYGSLGDYPQYVTAYSTGGIDTRRYPISIKIGEGAEVVIDYSPEAFMTAEDVEDFCLTTILPMFLVECQKLIDKHNQDATAHPSIRATMAGLDSRLSLLELMYNTNVSGNPFTVTFEDLEDVTVTGIWNQAQARIEF